MGTASPLMLTTVANMSQIYYEIGFKLQRSRLIVSFKFLMKKSAYGISEGGILFLGPTKISRIYHSDSSREEWPLKSSKKSLKSP